MITVLHELAPNPFFMQHVLGLTPSLCNMTPSSYSGLLPILFHPPNVALIGGQKVDPFSGVKK